MDVDLGVSSDEFERLVASHSAVDDLAGSSGGLVMVEGGSFEPLVVPPLFPAVVVQVGRPDEPHLGGADALATSEDLAVIRATVDANPQAATALAVLLRGGSDRTVADGLAAESAVYGVLQAGAEFAAWRSAHPPAAGKPTVGDPVIVSRHGDVLHLALDRAEARNALDASMRDALVSALLIALEDPTMRVELSGDGPTFCSGGHLDEFGTRTDSASAHLLRVSRSLGWLLHQLADRLTVRVHGASRGSGVELPAFAGQLTADPDATFGLPEVSMGLIPGAGGTVSLPRRIGRQRTAWLALSGNVIDAPTALAWGLVDEVAPA